MTRREQLFAVSGSLAGVLVTYGAVQFSNAYSRLFAVGGEPHAVDAAPNDETSDVGDAGVDPAMQANANLTQSLHECSLQLAGFVEDKAQLEQQLDAERATELDASRAAQARRIARRDVSQDDWKLLASSGTVRYVLPCASFAPPPEVVNRLGLDPREVPAIRSAFAAARDAAWSQIRPLCVAGVGSAAAAETLGLDACPQVILASEQATNRAAADAAMRTVGAVRAGLADSSAIPPDDPVGVAFLLLTGIAKDAEARLAAVLSPEDARSVVYGNNGCTRVSEFTSGAAPVQVAGTR